ncbi:hypothetical protein ACFL4T_04845 [candidate division KSB1 bacterium]
MHNEIPFSKDEVKFFNKFDKRANKRRGLCERCKNVSVCTLPFNPMISIMQCKEYEEVEISTKQIPKIRIELIRKKKDLHTCRA